MGIFKPMFRGREMAPLPEKTDLEAIKDVMKSLLETEIEIETLGLV